MFEVRNVGASVTTNTVCLDLNSSNTSPNTATGGNGTGFRLTNDAGVFNIEGLSGTPSAFLSPRNNGGTVTAAGTFGTSAGCANSTAPLAPPVLNIPASNGALAATTPANADALATATAQSGNIIDRPFIALPQQPQPVAQQPTASVVEAQAAPASTNAKAAKMGNRTQDESQARKGKGLKENPVRPQVANFPITIGTLGAGKSVTITFSVTVNNPLASSVTQVSNQGTVSGTGFSNVLTDDPDVAGANNPTVTAIIPQPTIAIRNATAPEPASGSAPMAFTVVLSNAYTVPVTVNFQTADGTATAGQDYTATSGTLSFPAGALIQTISIPVLSDADAAESDENFTVTLSTPVSGTISGTGIGTGTITALNTPGTVLISEMRTSGPGTTGTGDPNDDFVELYNNTNSPITVAASDASAGWALVKGGATCTDTPVIIGVVPNGTVIPARGHYLLVGSGYSLGSYATGNLTLTANIEADSNVALFNTATLANISSVTRLDAVGFDGNTGNNCDLLREGANLPAATGSISQYSFVRKQTTGVPLDTNDSTADFQVVSTTPATAVGSTAQPTLGAPGTENLASPIQRNATIKSALVDVGAASTAPPNRVRDATATGANATFGTLVIRRKFTNSTGAAVTRLRFRIVDITTAPVPAGTADLRALTSSDVTVNLAGGGTALVRGLTLEQPPTQPNGGGLNSTLSTGVVTVGTPIANGASINVEFRLGVQQNGGFRFFINVEALP